MSRRTVFSLVAPATVALGLLGPAVTAQPPGGVAVGRAAPPVIALFPSGDAVLPEQQTGKVVLLVFWSLQDAARAQLFERLRAVRKEFARDDRLRIISVCTDSDGDSWETWGRFLLDQGAVDFGDGPRRFMDDDRWWNVFQNHGVAEPSSRRYGVTTGPAAFLIGPDGRLLAVRIPAGEIRERVAAVLKQPPDRR